MEVMVYLLMGFVYSVIALPAEALYIAFLMLMCQILLISVYFGAKTSAAMITTRRNLLAGNMDDEEEGEEAERKPKGEEAKDAKGKEAEGEPKRKIDFLKISETVTVQLTRIMRPAVIGMMSLMGGCLIFFFVVNQFFLGPVVHWALNSALGSFGTIYTFENFSGNLITGRMEFKDLLVIRRSKESSSYKIRIKTLMVDIDFMSLFARPITISELNVEGVQAKLLYRNTEVPLGAKRNFIVKNLNISKGKFLIARKGQKHAKLAIDTLNVSPIRSSYALSDMVFHATAIGRLDNEMFRIKSELSEKSRVTEWSLKNFPAASLSKIFQTPPLDWFKSGRVNIYAIESWDDKHLNNLQSSWQMTTMNVEVQLPKDMPPFRYSMYQPIVDALNERGAEYTVRFKFDLDESDFHGERASGLGRFWEEVGEGLMEKWKPEGYEKL